MAGTLSRNSLYKAQTIGFLQSVEDAGKTTGDRWFVDSGASGASDATTHGRHPEKPFATIDYAIGQCTANNGDLIYVMPGHAENITAADGIDVDVAGVRIQGLGHGADIPTISFTAAAGSITIAAASAYLANLKLVANFATGTTAGITIAAAGDNCTLDGIVMRDTANTSEFLLNISVATTVLDLVIKNCNIIQLSGGSATNAILFAGTTSNLVLENNLILADSTDSVVDHLVGAATNCLIKDNIIYNEDTVTAGYVLDFHASSTGMAVGNRGAYNKIDAEMTKGAAMWWIENYFSNTIAESGLLEPSSAHAIP
jgi:hypothetical protein